MVSVFNYDSPGIIPPRAVYFSTIELLNLYDNPSLTGNYQLPFSTVQINPCMNIMLSDSAKSTRMIFRWD
jgi:hypothetical protein